MFFIGFLVHLFFLTSISSEKICHAIHCGTGLCVETSNPIIPYYCQCPNGSNSILPCTDKDPCASNPCHQGKCHIVPSFAHGYMCRCSDDSLAMMNCNRTEHRCYSNNPCINGVCRENATHVSCDCLPGWTGQWCEEKLYSPCKSNRCGSGRCFPINDRLISYVCLCLNGEFSQSCSSITVRSSNCECQNNGTCHSTPTGVQCLCKQDFTGRFCQTYINQCASNPCHYGGICHKLTSSYICACPDGSYRSQCSPPNTVNTNATRIFRCPCQNEGVCSWTGNVQLCICPQGLTGRFCEQVLFNPTCEQVPCANGGTCYRTAAKTSFCSCAHGFTGSFCETEYFRCRSNGRFADRYHCAKGKYFECVHADLTGHSPSNGMLLSRHCPATLRFNVLVDRCDYAENVHCVDG